MTAASDVKWSYRLKPFTPFSYIVTHNIALLIKVAEFPISTDNIVTINLFYANEYQLTMKGYNEITANYETIKIKILELTI